MGHSSVRHAAQQWVPILHFALFFPTGGRAVRYLTHRSKTTRAAIATGRTQGFLTHERRPYGDD